METHLKVLTVDAQNSFYRVDRYKVGDFFGPVDLGLHLSGKTGSLNIGAGLLAGSIFPGSNRLIFTGFSPCWGGFYISSMGGAGVEFDDMGINMLSIRGRAPVHSVLYLNRLHGEEIEVEIRPVDARKAWEEGRGGTYALMDLVHGEYGGRYEAGCRVLATGPAAESTDFGGIVSAPLRKAALSPVDTWAGRGGFGTKLLNEHGLAAVIFGGTQMDEDFRDRTVADSWFEAKYRQKMAAKDIEATTKYRFDPKFKTGGTFGVNFAGIGGKMLSFNYRSVFMDEGTRTGLHREFVLDHYLKQFNEETIGTKSQKTCGEPCAAVCKKMRESYKKDYEPYQAMGPLSGVFDQRAAEKLAHHADMLGFDAISAGGVVAWLMECLAEGELEAGELGVQGAPHFSPDGFDVVSSSMNNAGIGVGLLDSIVRKRGILDLSEGARKFARRLSREKGKKLLDRFVYTAFGRKGWMVPNQYWTPGVLSPMAIAGKYYMNYGSEFMPPRALGRACAERFQKELVMDNLGLCRFHRGWAEEMLPEIFGTLFGLKSGFLENVRMTASRINSRNSGVYWETERNLDFIAGFFRRKRDVDGDRGMELAKWIDAFDADRREAGLGFWYEMHKGIQESLSEF